MTSMLAKRPSSLKGAPGTASRIPKYVKEHLDFQVATALANKQAEENQGNQARVHVTSHSTADDDEGTAAAGMGSSPS